ncbi:MAG: replication-relaxation family protein [Rubrobacter sp.]
MALRTGRAGATTPRDEQVFEDLFWTRFLSTGQIAELRFPSSESARVRMYSLMRKGWVVNQVLAPNEILWRLTREGFERVRTSLDRDKEPTPDFFSGQKLRHYVESNDLYVRAAPRLERALGGYPAWGWINEGRAHRRYELGGRRFVHQPDAEIRLPGHLFFLERQSGRARYGGKTIREKVAAYGIYVDRVLRPEGVRVEVLFAADLEREKRAAVEAGYEYGVEVVASSVRGVAGHLESVATSS